MKTATNEKRRFIVCCSFDLSLTHFEDNNVTILSYFKKNRSSAKNDAIMRENFFSAPLSKQ